MHGLKLGNQRGSIAPERAAGIPSTSRTGQTRFARSGHIELQTSANQPESLDRCTDLLGTIVEQNGDGLLEQSHMPVGWLLHIDGAVRQSCAHRDTTLQELDDLLGEYDLKRDLVEINRKFFPSNAFMALARSFNMFYCMLQDGIN